MPPPSPRSPKGCDACRSLRKSYAALLRALTFSRWVSGALSLLPIIYVLLFLIANSVGQYAYSAFLTGPGYTIFAVLLLSWGVMAISLWKTCPNLLTLSIFAFTCFGHWALVTFVIILGYVVSAISLTNFTAATGVSNLLTAALLPPILLLLFAADVMTTQRARMYEELNAAELALAAASGNGAAADGGGKAGVQLAESASAPTLSASEAFPATPGGLFDSAA